MADRPQSPSKQAEVKKAEVDVIVPPTELVLSMAPAFVSREMCMDYVLKAIDATKKGMSVRFA
jgi:hypothetical protein